MKILHITHTDINSDSRILKEMQSIAKSNNLYDVQGIGIKRDESRNSSTIDGIRIHSLEIRSRKWSFLPNIIKHIFIFIELYLKIFLLARKLKPKVVHCHDILVLPAGGLIKFFSNSKLIYDAHELESNKNGTSKIESKIVLFTEKFFWKSIDYLIVVSPSISQWYESNVGQKNTKIIMNAPFYKENNTFTNNDYLRNTYDIPKSSRIFIYIGGFMKGRGIEILTEIFKNKDINSHIVFLGYGQLRDELLAISSQYKNIHIHDAVPHEEVINVAKSADIGLCFIQNISLSDYYCLPNKLFEYAFAKIPMLASDFPDIITVVNKYNLGKCSSLNIENISKTIKEFESMEELPKIDVEKLYDLSWEAQEEKLIQLYDRLIDRTK